MDTLCIFLINLTKSCNCMSPNIKILLFRRGSGSKTSQTNFWMPIPMDWIRMKEGEGWQSWSMNLRLFRKQYSKTFASHTPASHSRCTCFFLDTVEWRRAADVFRVDEPDSGISGALSFNFTLIVIWKQSNSHLSCCRESSEEACHLHGISLI